MSDVREGTAPVTGDSDSESAERTDGGPDSQPEDQPDSQPDRQPEGRELVKQLEQEGDVAADYLEELLDIADLDGDIDLDVDGDRAAVAVVGQGLEHLVGPEGSVLEALQELTRMAVYRETGERSRLMLDVAEYRANRRRELVALAERVAEKVRSNGAPERLEPMTPFERKIVHDAVAAKGLTSESEGEEPERRVVVQLP